VDTDLDPRLLAHVAEVMSHQPRDTAVMQATPPPAPADGQSREEWAAGVAKLRADYEKVARVLAVHLMSPGSVPVVDAIEDHEVHVDGGSITARVYRPTGSGPRPAIVFLHGGAWWQAGGETNFLLTDDYCKVFAGGLDAIVLNVDYRLAPEFPFPQQLEDSYAGVRWVVDHASELGVDPGRVSVMGVSSGGNQAAAVCLLARERGLPIASQILHVPALDLTCSSPSMQADPNRAHFAEIVRLYATHEQLSNPLVSPLLAPSLEGLPPTLVVTGDYDVLRDDGTRYAQRLAEAGVPVWHLNYPMFHNIALPETTDRMFAEMIEVLRPLV
jgi:acetyl esterase